MKVTKTSIYTNRKNTFEINITEEQYQQWKDGEDISEHLTYEEREFLKTGATPEELDEMDDTGGFEGSDPGPYDWEW